MADPNQEAEELENWIDDTREKIFKAAAGSTGRRRSSVAQSKEFTKLVKDLQEDYSNRGFDEKLKEETLATMNAKKPMKAAKKGTLKEKKDAMASLLNTVVERTEGMNDAWEHFASADPAFANVASYRNTDKTCPKGGMMAQKNGAVPYETKGMEGGMDMFETQFDGVVKAVEKACKDP